MTTSLMQPASQTSIGKSAVILFSHGSLLCGAGAPLDRHAERLRNMPEFGLVEVGYLNYSTPTFEDAVAKVAGAGATAIVVVPFFLAPGYFVTTSLPRALGDVKDRFPGLTFIIAQPIGFDDALTGAVRQSAYASRPPIRWRDGLAESGASCRLREDCPMYGQAGCGPGAMPVARVIADRWVPTHEREEFNQRRPSLLVLAHGSPSPEANAPMLDVIERVRQTSLEFRNVQVGYLECNYPSISESIDLCVEAEPDLIITVPYFLHMGSHVASDLPDALDEGRLRYPGIDFEMGDFVGNLPQVTYVLAKRARAAFDVREHTGERR